MFFALSLIYNKYNKYKVGSDLLWDYKNLVYILETKPILSCENP